MGYVDKFIFILRRLKYVYTFLCYAPSIPPLGELPLYGLYLSVIVEKVPYHFFNGNIVLEHFILFVNSRVRVYIQNVLSSKKYIPNTVLHFLPVRNGGYFYFHIL